MSDTVELCDITTDPQSSIVEHVNFITKDERGLDGLEYHLGLWRGDIARYRDQPIMSTSLRSDMVELLETSSWALLPATNILETIRDLYDYNDERSTATDKRRLFTDFLPEGVYEYQLMPVCTPEQRPVYVSGKCYRHPYQNMPRIRSTVHPCFVLRLLRRYRHQKVNLDFAPSPISTDDSIRSLISDISITASSCVNVSWLHGTWYDFPERGVAVACPDSKPPAPEPPVPAEEEEEEEEEIHTDEERDLEDPRLTLARYKLLKYMATHNTRLGGTAAAPPTTASSADVPKKRKRTPASTSPAPSDSSAEQSGMRRSKRLKESKKPPSQDAPIISNLATPPSTGHRKSRRKPKRGSR